MHAGRDVLPFRRKGQIREDISDLGVGYFSALRLCRVRIAGCALISCAKPRIERSFQVQHVTVLKHSPLEHVSCLDYLPCSAGVNLDTKCPSWTRPGPD